MFRRPRRPIASRAIARNLRRNLFETAYELETASQPDQAAEMFTQMADQMQNQGRLRQAANLRAQAAHHWLNANNLQKAQLQADMAINLFNQSGIPQRAEEFKIRFERHQQQPCQPESTAVQPKPAKGRWTELVEGC